MIPGSVAVAYLHPGHYSACFAESLQDLLLFDLLGPDGQGGEQRIIPNGQKIAKQAGSAGIVDARNQIARVVLDDTACEWLFAIDTDMGFSADTVERLIAAADPHERPVVGGLCFAMKHDGRGELYANRYRICPTAYEFHELEDTVGFAPIFDYPRGQLVEVSATGAACMLVHRSALEAVRERYGPTWFDPITHPVGPTRFSEDLSFCVRLAACGLPMHVHTGVKTTHDKGGIFLDEETYDRQQATLALPAAA